MTSALLIGAFALGAALGAAHFLSLRWTVALMRESRTALGLAIQGGRFVLLALALVMTARQGANTFLAAAAGVLVVRLILMSHYRRLG